MLPVFAAHSLASVAAAACRDLNYNCPCPAPLCLSPCCAQIPGGWAAQRWGGERMLSVSFALWSLACLATPGNAVNTRAIAAARISVGLAQVGAQAGEPTGPLLLESPTAALLGHLAPCLPACPPARPPPMLPRLAASLPHCLCLWQ